jgi:hypothetical protein
VLVDLVLVRFLLDRQLDLLALEVMNQVVPFPFQALIVQVVSLGYQLELPLPDVLEPTY